MPRHRVEIASSLAAGIAGLLVLSYLMLDLVQNWRALSWVFLGGISLIMLLSPLGAYLHQERGWMEGRTLLWAAPVFLLALVVMALPSFGLLFVPATLLAIVAAASSIGARRA